MRDAKSRRSAGCRRFPAYNVIPGKVVTSLEVRDMDPTVLDAMYEEIQREVKTIETASGTRFTFVQTSNTAPVPAEPTVRATIDEAAAMLGLTRRMMPSGAGHDAEEIARLGPVGMIFVPSVGGVSHSPRELTRPEDVTNGANVLLHAVLALDARLAGSGAR